MNYVLDKQLALSKKLTACDRETYIVQPHQQSYSISFNAAVFESFRSTTEKFFTNSPEYSMRKDPVIDRDSNVTDDVLRISRMMNKDKLFTINVYRTTSGILVNGPHKHIKERILENNLITCNKRTRKKKEYKGSNY